MVARPVHAVILCFPPSEKILERMEAQKQNIQNEGGGEAPDGVIYIIQTVSTSLAK